ncbi:MAG: hypothetical protein KAY31_04200, partial [Flavobacterium sp.]|nr:hypothetical protein [Flavobacterium sp.]
SEALQFGTCSGLKMLSWDYPPKESLKNRVDDKGMYPVTCLTTITQSEKDMLLARKVLLAKDLLHDVELLNHIGINRNRFKNIIREASELCA